jgi:hypothetical protein
MPPNLIGGVLRLAVRHFPRTDEDHRTSGTKIEKRTTARVVVPSACSTSVQDRESRLTRCSHMREFSQNSDDMMIEIRDFNHVNAGQGLTPYPGACCVAFSIKRSNDGQKCLIASRSAFSVIRRHTSGMYRSPTSESISRKYTLASAIPSSGSLGLATRRRSTPLDSAT